jgi:dsDNA-specific endonuclease/ATPase MutS2
MNTLVEAGAVDSATMDAHTLELLGFDKVRELLAGYAASSLGRDLALRIEPSLDIDFIRRELVLTTEMRSEWDRRRHSAVCTMSGSWRAAPLSAPC